MFCFWRRSNRSSLPRIEQLLRRKRAAQELHETLEVRYVVDWVRLDWAATASVLRKKQNVERVVQSRDLEVPLYHDLRIDRFGERVNRIRQRSSIPTHTTNLEGSRFQSINATSSPAVRFSKSATVRAERSR